MDNTVREQREKALLCAVGAGETETHESLEELAELAKSAGADVSAVMMQLRKAPVAATYIGTGKLKEIKEYCENQDIDLLIFDDELTPTQQRNIEKAVGVRVIDRTLLILDIFAVMAKSSEGRIQVELAQLEYLLPRLAGTGTQLSRLGGGIGTRGPGETKLESDRRHIRRRIHALKLQLHRVERHRSEIRRRRKKNALLTVAIVGYTNAGKSTLFNTLTDAGVLVQDKLFATLDPKVRALKLSDGRQILIFDTVGFIRKLPHHLVEAFHSTLEEAVQADILLNVCDASSPHAAEHLQVTADLLEKLGCAGKPMITVLNKCDLIKDPDTVPVVGNAVKISAKYKDGIDTLLSRIEQAVPYARIEVPLRIPFDKGELLARIRANGEILQEEYKEDGVYVQVRLNADTLALVQEYLIRS